MLKLIDILRSPQTGEKLQVARDGSSLVSATSRSAYPIIGSVCCFLEKTDRFYEGAYLNRIKFIPKKESGLFRLPFWFINGGYVWDVRKHVDKGSVILELGCASGVDYFGKCYKMIGLDVSLSSLQGLKGYELAIQGDAQRIPLIDASVDAVISSYFWEHIDPKMKDQMLQEFRRVLKPGGKIVFLYDVETANSLICRLKKQDSALYNRAFIEGDSHLGYETPFQNRVRFESAGFNIIKHFGMERTIVQSPSVWIKMKSFGGSGKRVGGFLHRVTSMPVINHAYTAFIRLLDETFGRLFHSSKSRIIITVARKL